MPTSDKFSAREIALSKGSILVHVAGEGPDVIYLHAAAGHEIRAAARSLAEHFRVWAPVVPGYEKSTFVDGISDAPAVADLVAELVMREMQPPCCVVGHSMGARIASWLAIRHPEKVARLILMAPAGFRPPGAPPVAFDPPTMLAQLYRHPERRPPPKPADVLASNREAMRHYGVGAPRDEVLAARMGEIRASTLVVGGACDVRVPIEAVREVRERVPSARMLMVDDAAHSLEVDQPQAVGEIVCGFFTEGEAFLARAGAY